MEWKKAFNETEKYLIVKGLKERTIKDYLKTIKVFSKAVEKKPLELINQDFVNFILSQKTQPQSKNVYSSLKQLAVACNLDFVAGTSLYKNAPEPKEEPKEEQTTTPEPSPGINTKFDKVFGRSDKESDFDSIERLVLNSYGRAKIISLLTLGFGVSPEKIITLKVGDLDFEANRLKLNPGFLQIPMEYRSIFRDYVEAFESEFGGPNFLNQYLVPSPKVNEQGLLEPTSIGSIYHFFPVPYTKLKKYYLLSLVNKKVPFEVIEKQAVASDIKWLFKRIYTNQMG